MNTVEPLEPTAPGQADPEPVGTNVRDAKQFARSIEGVPATPPGKLPAREGLPHCAHCWGYHHPEEPHRVRG